MPDKPLRPPVRAQRLLRSERRRQLIEVARRIVREEGTDQLTLGHLARAAGVSKPVVYDHFETRDDLLIALYRIIDTDKVDAFRNAMAAGEHTRPVTIDALSRAYVNCAIELDGEFHAVGSALVGNDHKAQVLADLLRYSVSMFVDVLQPHSSLPADKLRVRCTALVGAGEALSASVIRGDTMVDDAVAAFLVMIDAASR